MGRKKNRKAILVILGIIGLLILLNYMGVFKKEEAGNPFVLVPIDCPINQYCHISASSTYQCPIDVDKCRIKATAICNVAQTPAKVIFRASGSWIAWDWDNNGALECFVKTAVIRYGSCNIESYASQTINKGMYNGVTFNTNGQYIFVKEFQPLSNQYCADPDYFYTLSDSSNCVISTSPVTGYTDNELTFGTQNVFTCNSRYQECPTSTVPCPAPTYEAGNSFIYSSSISGNKTVEREINPGTYAMVFGGNENIISYSNLEDKETCTYSLCNVPLNTGYFNCKNGIVDRTNLTYCKTDVGESCQNGKCTIPFQTQTVSITDSSGNVKTGFTSNELIKVNVLLIGKAGTALADVHSGTVRLEFYKLGESQVKTNVERSGVDFGSGSALSLSIDNPGADGDLGMYYLVVKAIYDATKPAIVIGLDNPNQPTYQISIGSEVSCSIQLQTSDTSIEASTLITNIPILVKLNTRVSGAGQAVLNRKVTAYINKGTATETSQILGEPVSQGTSGDAYTYVYNYATDKPGDLFVKAEISESNVPATCVGTSKVSDMTITTTFSNYGGNCLPPGSKTFTFSTIDKLNRPDDTINVLCVKKPGSGTLCEPITSLIQPVSGTVGKYQFTYNLVKNVGETANYEFTLKTTSIKYNREYTTTLPIEVKDSCTASECITTKDCESKGDTFLCVNGVCKDSNPKYIMYIGIGIGIIILLLALYFIYRAYAKPRETVYTGLEGL